MSSYCRHSAGSGIDGAQLLVFGGSGKETALAVPWDGEDCVLVTVNDVHWFCLLHVPHDTLWTCKYQMLHQMSLWESIFTGSICSTWYTVNIQTWNVTSDVIVRVNVHWFHLFHVPHDTLWTYKQGMLHQMLWQSLFTGSACSTPYTVNMQTWNVTSAVIVTVNVHWFHLFHIPHPTLWTCKHGMLQQVSLRQEFFFKSQDWLDSFRLTKRWPHCLANLLFTSNR